MATLVKRFAIGMVLSVALATGLGLVGASDAQASEGWTNEQLVQWYLTHDNDTYVNLVNKWDAAGYEGFADRMRYAADLGCKGTLYEDLSCKEREGIEAADVLPDPTDAACEAFAIHHQNMVRAEDGSLVPASFYR